MAGHSERPLKRVNPSGKTRWVARFTGADGKRRSAGTFGTRRDAQAAIVAAYEREGRASAGIASVGAYAATWLDRHPRADRTNVTMQARLKAALPIVVDGRPLGDWPLVDLRRRHGSRLLDVLLVEHGRAASGARAVLTVMSALFEDAIDDGFAEVNPFAGMRVRANDKRVRKPPRRETAVVLTFEEMHALAAAAGPDEPMIRVLADCGLRLGELLALQRADWRGETLHVHRRAWRGDAHEGTKGVRGAKRRERVVPVPPGCEALLRAMPPRIDSDLLFPRPSGRVWHERNWYREVWQPAVQRAGLEVTPHDLRHSYVSLMRARGVDPADLAYATGHTVETATSVYTHATGASFDEMREVAG